MNKLAEQSPFMDPSSSNIVGQAQHVPPLQPPTLQIPQASQASVSAQVNYLSDREQRDANLQVCWSTWMSDVQKNPSVYKHVFVLLVSWHADCDDMSVGDEVYAPPQRLSTMSCLINDERLLVSRMYSRTCTIIMCQTLSSTVTKPKLHKCRSTMRLRNLYTITIRKTHCS